MKSRLILPIVCLLGICCLGSLSAQPTSVTADSSNVVAHSNSAIVPVPREGRAEGRQSLVLQRAKDHPGECDIIFVGDSITQGWESRGKEVWRKYYGDRDVLNFGVGGDRTQHVLWRFEHGQLDGVKPRAAVLMIGTNNSNRDDNTEGEILEGVTEIVKEMRKRLPETKILLVSIFPRGQTFSRQRGKILQVNQALEKLADGQNIIWVDFGYKLIEPDGGISKEMMPDYLHPNSKGYEIWAEAIEPTLKQILSD